METSSADQYPDERGEQETDPFGVYEGERNENGERHGSGKALLPNGDMYVGEYRNGLRDGKGTYMFRNGARYDGDWRRGHKYGQGTFWYPDGTRYEGEWEDDAKHGFGVYYYVNNDIYEGSWKRNLRHGMGTYLYADTGAKFMGTWMEDRMQGPGQLVHAHHRFHGFWKRNLPYGRGCFIFENDCMQHGYYIHAKYSARGDLTWTHADKVAEEDENDEKSEMTEESKADILPLWRARCITPYNPELLPPEAVPLREEYVSPESWIERSEDDIWPKIERYADYEEGDYHEEYLKYYQGEARSRIDSP
nr:PREDICTED: radial spoke head 1 homolog isoform X1 [Linepithema humile]